MPPIRKIPEDSAAYSRWLAGQIENRWGGLWLTPETAIFVGMALEGYARYLDDRAASKLTFKVTAFNQFDQGEVIAAAMNISVASAAYQAGFGYAAPIQSGSAPRCHGNQ